MTRPQKNSHGADAQIQSVDGGKFLISGDLDFTTVPGVWKASQLKFARTRSLVIDFSGVVRSDSAGLALLIEWMRYAKTNDTSLQFLNLPDQMLQIAQLCGVHGDLPV